MRTIIVIVSVMLVSMAITGYLLLNKEHRSAESEDFIPVEANELFAAFESDEAKANQMYLDKVVAVKGIVSEIMVNQDGESILLLRTDNEFYGVSCTMVQKPKDIDTGTEVVIKGICTGYLSDVIVTRGVLAEKLESNTL